MDEYVVYFLIQSKDSPSFGWFQEFLSDAEPTVFADYPATLSESYMLVNPNPN